MCIIFTSRWHVVKLYVRNYSAAMHSNMNIYNEWKTSFQSMTQLLNTH